jgi:hypothetical protein
MLRARERVLAGSGGIGGIHQKLGRLRSMDRVGAMSKLAALLLCAAVGLGGCFMQKKRGGSGAGGQGGQSDDDDDGSGGSPGGEGGAGTSLTGACGLEVGSFPADCAACLEVTCCQQLEMCSQNPACIELVTCIDPCDLDESCSQACGAAHAAGRDEYLMLGSCALDLCTAECG